MRQLVVLTALVLTPSLAFAEPYDATEPPPVKDGYIGVGLEAGAQRALMGGIKVDGGKRIGTSPLFAHAQITGGASGSDGSYQQVRIGVEARGCVLADWVCAFGGVDAGYQHDHMIDTPWFWASDDGGSPPMEEVDAHDLMAVPRVGLELGTPIRLRTALELPFTTRLDTPETRAGVAVSMGLAYAF